MLRCEKEQYLEKSHKIDHLNSPFTYLSELFCCSHPHRPWSMFWRSRPENARSYEGRPFVRRNRYIERLGYCYKMTGGHGSPVKTWNMWFIFIWKYLYIFDIMKFILIILCTFIVLKYSILIKITNLEGLYLTRFVGKTSLLDIASKNKKHRKGVLIWSNIKVFRTFSSIRT